MVVWTRHLKWGLVWISLMLTFFIISCNAFAGGSWVSPTHLALAIRGFCFD